MKKMSLCDICISFVLSVHFSARKSAKVKSGGSYGSDQRV